MKSNLGNLSWVSVKSALVSVLIMAIIAMSAYVIGIGDIFKIDGRSLINIGIMSVLTGIVSLAKSFFTTSDGNFMGAVKVTE